MPNLLVWNAHLLVDIGSRERDSSMGFVIACHGVIASLLMRLGFRIPSRHAFLVPPCIPCVVRVIIPNRASLWNVVWWRISVTPSGVFRFISVASSGQELVLSLSRFHLQTVFRDSSSYMHLGPKSCPTCLGFGTGFTSMSTPEAAGGVHVGARRTARHSAQRALHTMSQTGAWGSDSAENRRLWAIR